MNNENRFINIQNKIQADRTFTVTKERKCLKTRVSTSDQWVLCPRNGGKSCLLMECVNNHHPNSMKIKLKHREGIYLSSR